MRIKMVRSRDDSQTRLLTCAREAGRLPPIIDCEAIDAGTNEDGASEGGADGIPNDEGVDSCCRGVWRRRL